MNYIMKKIAFITGLFCVALNAQVGIETDKPTEKLDVNGTIRVRDLPENGKGKIYNGKATKREKFKATRNVVADDKGVIGFVKADFDSKSVSGFANRCVKGFVKDKDFEKESEITLDGLSVRFKAKKNADASEIQVKSIEDELITMRPDGEAFLEIGKTKGWRRIRHFNYDQEYTAIAVFTLHNKGAMYRYTAQGWKQYLKSELGFCHSLELIGKWDGN